MLEALDEGAEAESDRAWATDFVDSDDGVVFACRIEDVAALVH